METIFTSLGGTLIFLAFIFLALLWPILLMYAVWRLLRGVDRIASATERMARAETRAANIAEVVAPLSISENRGGISTSAFGR
jgi:hypothetical protein